MLIGADVHAGPLDAGLAVHVLYAGLNNGAVSGVDAG